MKRVKCVFCDAVLPVPVVIAEEGYCPECGEDLRDLVGYKEPEEEYYEEDEDDVDWDF